MLVAPAVAGVKARGVDGQLHAPRAALVDLEPPVDRVKATLDLYQSPEMRTRNSALECVGSIAQRVVVLIEIFLSVVGWVLRRGRYRAVMQIEPAPRASPPGRRSRSSLCYSTRDPRGERQDRHPAVPSATARRAPPSQPIASSLPRRRSELTGHRPPVARQRRGRPRLRPPTDCQLPLRRRL